MLCMGPFRLTNVSASTLGRSVQNVTAHGRREQQETVCEMSLCGFTRDLTPRHEQNYNCELYNGDVLQRDFSDNTNTSYRQVTAPLFQPLTCSIVLVQIQRILSCRPKRDDDTGPHKRTDNAQRSRACPTYHCLATKEMQNAVSPVGAMAFSESRACFLCRILASWRISVRRVSPHTPLHNKKRFKSALKKDIS